MRRWQFLLISMLIKMSQQKPSSKKRESSRAPWPFSAAASLVNRLARQVNEGGKATTDIYGLKCSASFARLDLAGSWRKTCGGFSQLTLDGHSEEYCQTWPKMGIVLDGYAMELEMSVRRTGGKGCLSWLTPRAGNPGSRKPGTGGEVLAEEAKRWATPQSRDYRTGEAHRWDNPEKSRNLNDQVAKEYWPTPKNRDYRSPRGGAGEQRNNPDLNVTAYMQENKPQKGQLNPAWVTLLMGFPPGWLDIDGPPESQTSVMWPTPTSCTGNNAGRLDEWGGKGNPIRGTEEGKGQLNPAWVTLLMGFPPGWLDIDGPPAQAPSTPGNRRE